MNGHRTKKQNQTGRNKKKRYGTNDPPWTMSVPEAGRKYFDLGRNASYAAARRGDIPVIQVGRLLRAVVAALERKLEAAGQGPS
jgi:hypothetical protein